MFIKFLVQRIIKFGVSNEQGGHPPALKASSSKDKEGTTCLGDTSQDLFLLPLHS